jgi:hypothetical protein
MDLTLDDLQQRVGMLMMELWRAAKIIADLKAQLTALAPPPETPNHP